MEELNVRKRLKKVTGFINRELEILELGSKIQSEIKGEFDKAQRQYYLREQLKAIQRELGEVDEQTMEIDELRKSIEQAQLPPEALKEAERELDRLSKMPPQAAEYSVAKTYLDWVTSLPWAKSTEESVDVKRAAEILDEDHYDLEKVKERILEYLAVRKLKQDMKGPILCFVGPPGTGKTSIGQSIARALGRKFVRMSLGGVRDEAEIRGHRRTYVGALPGRIIQGIRRAGSNDPVFMLDEIDKVGADFRGDPSAALLEVLDPEQNHAFFDHYLDVPFDLSKVMFITTANTTSTIPHALLDRMEIIEFPGYIEEDKIEITNRFLLPRQLEENGLEKDELRLTVNALQRIIREYTYEAGVRNLEREIGRVCRKIARQKAEGKRYRNQVGAGVIERYLGPPQFFYMETERQNEVGVATALAWTENGGETMPVEVLLVEGKGNLQITGQIGNVMQESAQASLSYLKSRSKIFEINPEIYDQMDIHIHIPEGAIPKDGPSAGITIATALVSAFTGREVLREVGMTGEITLRGRVLPVGGVREKVLAAHRVGLKVVILPKRNLKDLIDIPKRASSEVKIMPVEHMDQVLELSLAPAPQKAKSTRKKRSTSTPRKSQDTQQNEPSDERIDGPSSPHQTPPSEQTHIQPGT
ncbi:MAG: endopeptidase La [Anaerolineales bacterium]|nr:endopeptidase La [Anaerolineales bacterium]